MRADARRVGADESQLVMDAVVAAKRDQRTKVVRGQPDVKGCNAKLT
jgi:hypothetical protein